MNREVDGRVDPLEKTEGNMQARSKLWVVKKKMYKWKQHILPLSQGGTRDIIIPTIQQANYPDYSTNEYSLHAYSSVLDGEES